MPPGSQAGVRHEAATTNILVYLGILWRRRWLVLPTVALTVASAWVFIQLQTPVYRATATILIEPEVPKVVNIQEVTPGTGPPQDYYTTQTKLVQSRDIIEGVIARLKLKERIPEIGQAPDPYVAFLGLLTVENVKNTRLVTVSFENPDSKLSAEVANGVAGGYVKYNVDIKNRMAQQAGEWLQEQVGGLVARADRSAAALQAYQAKADLLGIQEQRQIITQKIMAYDKAHLESQSQRYAAEAKLREITRILKDPAAADAVFTVIDDPMVRKLKSEASDLLAERSKLREQYKSKHPDMVAIEAQIKHVNERIREEVGKLRQAVENEYQVAKAREVSMAASLNDLRRDAQQLVSKEARALTLQREKDSNDELVSTVMKRMKETGLATGLDANNVRIAEAATPPAFPAKPRKFLIQVLSVVLGLGLGCGLAFVLESIDNRVRSPEDVERVLGVPVIGLVPAFKVKKSA
jgi:succinoglycan biosynthesis transport protein ExoP